MIQDEGGNAGTSNITITAAGRDKLNGVTTGSVLINTNYGGKIIYTNGTGWFTVSGS